MTSPNIVQTNEVGSEDGRHFIVMEYLDGRTLHRIVRAFMDQGGFPLGAHLAVLAEALHGLHYAHELCGFDGQPLGIVHRDVSPNNVFVTFDGAVKVLDFGIAKAVDSSLITRTGVLKGRVAYMAPEQACGYKVDRRADIYAAGVMLWGTSRSCRGSCAKTPLA
jgi:serine/threonine-protein kinase